LQGQLGPLVPGFGLGAGLFGLVVGGLVAPVALWVIAPLVALIGRAMVSRELAPGS